MSTKALVVDVVLVVAVTVLGNQRTDYIYGREVCLETGSKLDSSSHHTVWHLENPSSNREKSMLEVW